MTEHSELLSPSASHIWTRCTAQPQAIIAAGIPNRTNEAAEKGTVQHEWSERIKKGEWDILHLPPKNDLWATQDDWVQGWMEVQTAIAAVDSLIIEEHDVKLFFEMKAGLSNGPLGEEYSQCFGTADVVLIDFTDRVLHIVDYKFGRGAVSEIMNSQLMIYALAVIDTLWAQAPMDIARLGDNFRVRMSIIQPKIRYYPATFEMWKAGLDKYMIEELRPAMDAILEGVGEFKAGPWCKKNYCDLRHDGQCPALNAEVSQTIDQFVNMMTGEKMTPVSDRETWVRKLLEFKTVILEVIEEEEALVLQSLLEGEFIPGFKPVYSGGSKRQWRSKEEAERFLKNKLKLDERSPRKLLTAPQAEKALMKAEKLTPQIEKRFNELIERTESKIVLALESDGRPAVDLTPSEDELLEQFKTEPEEVVDTATTSLLALLG